MRYPEGSRVRLSAKCPQLATYTQIYGVTAEDVLTVAHTEMSGRRRVLYLQGAARVGWMPAYPRHVRMAERKRRHKIKPRG